MGCVYPSVRSTTEESLVFAWDAGQLYERKDPKILEEKPLTLMMYQ